VNEKEALAEEEEGNMEDDPVSSDEDWELSSDDDSRLVKKPRREDHFTPVQSRTRHQRSKQACVIKKHRTLK